MLEIKTLYDRDGRPVLSTEAICTDPASPDFRHLPFITALQAGRLPHNAEYYAEKFAKVQSTSQI